MTSGVLKNGAELRAEERQECAREREGRDRAEALLGLSRSHGHSHVKEPMDLEKKDKKPINLVCFSVVPCLFQKEKLYPAHAKCVSLRAFYIGPTFF